MPSFDVWMVPDAQRGAPKRNQYVGHERSPSKDTLRKKLSEEGYPEEGARLVIKEKVKARERDERDENWQSERSERFSALISGRKEISTDRLRSLESAGFIRGRTVRRLGDGLTGEIRTLVAARNGTVGMVLKGKPGTYTLMNGDGSRIWELVP